MKPSPKTLLLLIIVLFLALRLISLNLQPVFIDEAIYINWSQTILDNPAKLLISLSDGKTPLFVWAMVPLQALVSDPLLAGRVVSVIAGLGTLLGVFFLANKFFSRKVALIASLLVAVTPYTLFFDRMALVDSMLSAFLIWSLYFALLLEEKPTLKKGASLLALLFLGFLAKTPAILGYLILPVVFLIKKDFRLVKYWTIGLVVSLAGLFILKHNHQFNTFISRSGDYYFPLSRLYQVPFDPFVIQNWFQN